MNDIVIIDTGIIVALIDKDDQWHEWAIKQAASLPIPYLTCEAVVTEACHLVKQIPNGVTKVLEFIEKDVLKLDFVLADNSRSIIDLVNKYQNVPMDFADGCLVRMSEIIQKSVVFTLDSDFRIYRKNGREAIPLVAPPEH